MLAWPKWGYSWLQRANSGPDQSLTEAVCPPQALKQAEIHSKPLASTPAPARTPASHTCKFTTTHRGLLNHPRTRPISYAFCSAAVPDSPHLTFRQGRNGREKSLLAISFQDVSCSARKEISFWPPATKTFPSLECHIASFICGFFFFKTSFGAYFYGVRIWLYTHLCVFIHTYIEFTAVICMSTALIDIIIYLDV